MQKRIKQLMAQTLDEKFSHTWSTMTPADLEKFVKHFAELLIRDCADVAYRFDGVTLGQGYTIAKHIKKNYEVES
jgi:ABC-type transporter MlaC component